MIMFNFNFHSFLFYFFFSKSFLRFLFSPQAANLQGFRSKLWAFCFFDQKNGVPSAARLMSFVGQLVSIYLFRF